MDTTTGTDPLGGTVGSVQLGERQFMCMTTPPAVGTPSVQQVPPSGGPTSTPPASPTPAPAPPTSGGGAQVIAGIEALGPVLSQLASVLTSLVQALGGASGGGGSLPPAPPLPDSNGAGANAAPAPGGGKVDPSTVKDKTGTGGLTAVALRGLEEAHTFGLPLVSGKRSGSGTSDHDHGNAIDVGTLPIGSPNSTEGTPQMQAFAEHMRQQGKAGQLDVKYVIADGRIASATNNWEWREYTYPGTSRASLDALKQSDRGEYNRIQHNDHVHVSFG